MKKQIVLNDNYLPNIVCLKKIYDEIQEILKNVFEKYMNEKNSNEYTKVSTLLHEYRFIKKDWIIPNGRYIRYLDISNPFEIQLKKGGFVMYSSKYIFKLHNQPCGKFTVGKENKIFFVKITDDEKFRCSLDDVL